MKYKLTIQEKLKDLRVENGLSLEQLADATGISKSALSSYEVEENREISSYSLQILAKFYNVTSDYLLGLSETRQPSPLTTNSLHISDDAVKILQNGKYNPMLLSEILTSDNFLRFMVDAEIYVDGNVTTQFHTLNKMVDAQRMIFVKKLCPDDYNLQVETLKRISIEEDAFFEHTLSEDIVRIMREIRARHLGDVESKADTSIVDRMVAAIDEVAGFKGTPLQKFKLIFQKWFGAKDIKLSDNADEQLETALNSELLKPVNPDKKKKRR
jgi:transcriptional regulator with XRE-family HTH domain